MIYISSKIEEGYQKPWPVVKVDRITSTNDLGRHALMLFWFQRGMLAPVWNLKLVDFVVDVKNGVQIWWDRTWNNPIK